MTNPRRFTLPEPPSANRWWRRAGTRIHLSNAARKYKESIAQLKGFAVEAGPVSVELWWYRGRKSGDLDKRIGVALDALQGVLYSNDSQIERLIAHRADDPGNPRLVVQVSPLEET